jgi:hypothetical protein
VQLFGIYRADGGLIGELRYLTGHLFRGEHCTLCDITHAGISRKRSWDAAVADLGVPFTLLHRNELTPDMAAFVGDRTACVIAQQAGEYTFLLGNDDLADCAGDVERFIALLTKTLAER